MVQSGMVISVDDLNLRAFASQDLHWLNSFLVLSQPRSRSVIREDKAVQNEVSIVRVIPKVSPISIILFSVFRPCSQALVVSVQKSLWEIPKPT